MMIYLFPVNSELKKVGVGAPLALRGREPSAARCRGGRRPSPMQLRGSWVLRWGRSKDSVMGGGGADLNEVETNKKGIKGPQCIPPPSPPPSRAQNNYR